MPKGVEVNRSDLAKLHGVSLPTIDSWIRSGCPYVKKPDGISSRSWIFDSQEVYQWLLSRALEGIRPDQPIDIDKAKARKIHLEAELAEMDLKERQGLLVQAEFVQKIGTDFVIACKTKLLALPKKLSPILNPKDPRRAEGLLEKGIHEALNELTQCEFFTDFDEFDASERDSNSMDSGALTST